MAQILLSNIAAAEPHREYRYTSPEIDGDALVLAASEGAHVRLQLKEPLLVTPPLPKKRQPGEFRASEILVGVDDPAGFIAAVGNGTRRLSERTQREQQNG